MLRRREVLERWHRVHMHMHMHMHFRTICARCVLLACIHMCMLHMHNTWSHAQHLVTCACACMLCMYVQVCMCTQVRELQHIFRNGFVCIRRFRGSDCRLLPLVLYRWHHSGIHGIHLGALDPLDAISCVSWLQLQSLLGAAAPCTQGCNPMCSGL